RVPLGGQMFREATLVEGPVGWGEFSPLPGYPCDPRLCEDAVREAVFLACPAAVRAEVPVNGLVPSVAAAAAAELLRVVEAAGVPAIVSSLYETSVGLAAGVALAAALPDLPFACGLGTAPLLAGDVVADPLVPEAGVLPVRRPEPDPDLLARWSVEG